MKKGVWSLPAKHTKKKYSRVIPLNKAAMRALKAMWLIRDPGSPRVFHALGTPGQVSTCFHMLTKCMGIKDFRFHDTRHEAISQMVLHEDFSPVELMKIVGHKRLEQLDRYANLRGEELVAKLKR